MQDVAAILPFAIGSAVSPLILTASIFAVSEPKQPLAKSLAYLAGAAISITIIGSAIILLNLGAKRVAATPSLVDVGFSLLAAIVLIYFAVKQLFKTKPATNKPGPTGSVGKYFALGFGLMLVNTSTIILYFPAAVVLTHDAASITGRSYGLVVMILFSLVPAAIAPVALLLLGKHAQPVLNKLSSFVKHYGKYIIAALFGAIGVYLLAKSLIALTHIL